MRGAAAWRQQRGQQQRYLHARTFSADNSHRQHHRFAFLISLRNSKRFGDSVAANATIPHH